MKPFNVCFVHAVFGLLGVLFLTLSAFGSAFMIFARKKHIKDNSLQLLNPVFEMRYKFDAVYFGIGTTFLLIAYVIGLLKEGFGSPKSISTIILLLFNFSVPIISRIAPIEKKRTFTEFLFLIAGALAILNVFVGNVFFTSFHNFL